MNIFSDKCFFCNEIPSLMTNQVPDLIFDEVKHFVEESRKTKEHPLGYLREHKNAGVNTFQITVPTNMFENSFTMAYINRLSEYYRCVIEGGEDLEKYSRAIMFRKYHGHHDGYEFWVNFTYKHDRNIPHTHSGEISGIIYVTETKMPTNFFLNDIEVSHYGKPGEILLFPSNLKHSVDENLYDEERITISFNLNSFPLVDKL